MVVCLSELGVTEVDSHFLAGSKTEKAGSGGKIAEKVAKES